MKYCTISNFRYLNPLGLHAISYVFKLHPTVFKCYTLCKIVLVNCITNGCCSNVFAVARQPHLNLSTFASLLTLTCTVCFKDFPTETTLVCHMQQHKQLLSPICSQVQYTGGIFGCMDCNVRFYTVRDLTQHLKTHKKIKLHH